MISHDRLRGIAETTDAAPREWLSPGTAFALNARELVSLFDNDDAAVRSAAGDLLVERGEDAILALASGIIGGGERAKLLAVHALGRIGGAAAAKVILEILRSPMDVNVLHAAIEGCVTLGVREAIPLLQELADRDPWLRFGAVRAICELEGPGSIGRLTPYLEDELARAEIMAAMRRSGDREFVLPLLEIAVGETAHESAQVRLEAATTILALMEHVADAEAIQCAQRLVASLGHGATPEEAPRASGELLDVDHFDQSQRASLEVPSAVAPAGILERSLLDRVLLPGALQLMVQPIVRIDEQETVIHSFECLVRGPAGTNLERPDVLFEYVRLKRREIAIDRACVDAAFRAMAGSQDSFSVNIHASTLGRDRGFVEFLTSLAEDTSTPLSRVVVEIVEHAPAWNSPGFLSSLEKLRELGMSIALDDIGLGQSNFKMILECRPDYFKIDRYFVAGCHRDPYRVAVLQSIFELSERFGGRVIAEGVEYESELECVKNIGIRLVQGFLFSRPVPPDLRGRITLPQ
ncbi:MAG: EAL domain-containing protein [Thermoanaerobaculia bacterium]|jgi:EAL domain-containing protein (putative c-di-GMP-specific phosphodiesterase class I)